MKVSDSSVAAYYAGNTALALDRQATQQAQAAAQQRLQQLKRPPPIDEQVLEGELLNQQREQQAQLEKERFSAQQHSQGAPLVLSSNSAIRQYQTTAQLDGLSGGGPLHQVDVYV